MSEGTPASSTWCSRSVIIIITITNDNVSHVQVHYISTEHTPASGDTSGVLVEYQEQPTEYSAGIVSLHVHGEVPGHTDDDGDHVLWDSACRLLGSTPVQPWAYLGHTHRLGRRVSG